jgi:hypothetical protein
VQASTPNSLGDSNPGPPSPRGKSQPLSLIFARIGGALEPNDSLKESRDALVTHSSTFPHATRLVFRAFDRSPSELGDSLVSRSIIMKRSESCKRSSYVKMCVLELDFYHTLVQTSKTTNPNYLPIESSLNFAVCTNDRFDQPGKKDRT